MRLFSVVGSPLAHPFSPHEGSWFVIEPTISLGVIALTALYLYAVGPLRRRYGWAERVEPRQVIQFLLAMLLIFVSLQGPLHELSDYYLFSAHMFQHLLVTLIMPPLLLRGLPEWLVNRLVDWPIVRPIMRFLTTPAIGFALFNVIFALWHVPSFYQRALGDPVVHGLEHALFMGTAVLTWWPVFSPTPLLPRLSVPASMFYLFAQSLIPTVLGAMITFASVDLYPFYAAAPRVIGLSPLDDQQAAGLLMWMGGASFVLLILTVRFFRWMELDADENLEPSQA